jgi:K+-transporting ATPase KdpF subunit
MSLIDVVAGIVALAVFVYLLWALLRAEQL